MVILLANVIISLIILLGIFMKSSRISFGDYDQKAQWEMLIIVILGNWNFGWYNFYKDFSVIKNIL